MLGQLRKIAKRRKVESGLSGFVPQTDLPFFDYLTGRQLSDTDAKELVLSGGIIHVPQMLQRMDLISDLEHIVGHSWDAFPTIHERLDQDDLVDEICTRRGLTETLVLQAKMLLSCGLKMQDELYLELSRTFGFTSPISSSHRGLKRSRRVSAAVKRRHMASIRTAGTITRDEPSTFGAPRRIRLR
jgi:hypothetical protein